MTNRPKYLDDLDRLDTTELAFRAAEKVKDEFESLTRLATMALQVPNAFVCMIKPNCQCFVGAQAKGDSCEGLHEAPLDRSFCQSLAVGKETVVVNDALAETGQCRSLGTVVENLRAYVGAPILLEGETRVGTFCVVDTEPREWKPGDAGMVAHFAHLAAISLRFRIEEELRSKMEDYVLHVDKMDAMGRFAGGIVHDFNNILMAIQGCADLADITDDTEVTRKCLQEIHHTVDRGSSLTKQLLAFSRKEPIKPEPITVDETIQGLESTFRSLLPDNISLTTNFGADHHIVHIDSGQFSQILFNLVANARDALNGSGSVTISTLPVRSKEEMDCGSLTLPAGEYVEIAVADDGVGIPEADRRKIFDPFFTTKEKGRGTGLGLSTVYGIIRGAGGAIRVDSIPGKGTTFSILMPMEPDGEPQDLAMAVEEEETIPDKPDGVLVLEDDPMVRQVLVLSLEAEGIEVLQATTRQEALECAQKCERFDLLVTDINLPDANGADVATEILQHCPHTLVLFMSGECVQDIPRQNLLGVLQKPFRCPEILKLWRMSTGARLPS